MYSGDAPPSLSSTAITSFDQEQVHIGGVDPQSFGGQNAQTWSNVRSINNPLAGPQIWATADAYAQPPSYPALGHVQGNRGPDQNAGFGDGGQAPSYTALSHDQRNPINQLQDGTVVYRGLGQDDGFDDVVEAPSVGAMRHVGVSLPSGGGVQNSDGLPPSLNDMGKREASQTGESFTSSPINESQGFVGMSLVGKNFKKYFQKAYYDDEGEN